MVYLAKSPLMSQYDLSSVRQVSCGAAPLSRQVELDFKQAVGLGRIEQGIIVVCIVCLIYYTNSDWRGADCWKMLLRSCEIFPEAEDRGEYFQLRGNNLQLDGQGKARREAARCRNS